MYEQLIISQDDFYPDPHAIRARALQLIYDDPPSQLNPQARGPIARFTATDEQSRTETIAKVAPLLPAPIKLIQMQYRYCHSGTVKKQICHADGTDYAGIVYLTLPEHCQGGTWFYRHRPSGHIRLDRAANFTYDFSNPADWELTYEAVMQFNRMLLYPGDLFHAIGTPYFGDSAANGRLTQTFFIMLKK